MVIKMKEELLELEKMVEQLVKGDCFTTFNPEEFSEAKGLAEKLKQLQAKMASQAFETQVASAQVASVSDKIETYFQKQTKMNQSVHQKASDIANINQQNLSLIDQTLNEANEALEVVAKTSESTNQLSQVGQASQKEIKKQVSEIVSVVQHIESIAESTKKTDKLLKVLQQSSNKISSIVDTVQAFSKQSHLVSMNASIEAARSGEAGKGFAVIADEMGRLAEESSTSVNGIYDLIEDLTLAIKDVTQCNEENQKTINETVQKSEDVNQGLNHIEVTYNTVLTHIDTIAELSSKSQLFFEGVEKTFKATATGVNQMANGFEILQQDIAEQFNCNRDIQKLKVRLGEAASGLEIVSSGTNVDTLMENRDQMKLLSEKMQRQLQKWSSDAMLGTLDGQTHQAKIDEWMNKYQELDALWTNDLVGNFIYSNPPSGIENAKIRKWFKEGVNGKDYISSVYISAISKKPCITISVPIVSENQIVGVLGADIDMQQ